MSTGNSPREVLAIELHQDVVNRISWSPSGRRLATASHDGTVALWDRIDCKLYARLRSSGGRVWTVSWSPGETRLATVDDAGLGVWDSGNGEFIRTIPTPHKPRCARFGPNHDVLAIGTEHGEILLLHLRDPGASRVLVGHQSPVDTLAWSPDERLLASGGRDGIVYLWDVDAGSALRSITDHKDMVRVVVWSRDGNTLATGSNDCTVRLYSAQGMELRVLEAHTKGISDLSFSSSDILFASRSWDNTIQVWRCDTWDTLATLHVRVSPISFSGMSFHPDDLLLAAHDDTAGRLRLWKVILPDTPADGGSSFHYKNAKIVLAGDTGVGKTGLRLRLLMRNYRPVDSTHGRYVATLAQQRMKDAAGNDVTCELLLWDLAGNPGYRVVNQLHLNQAAVAAVVFDAHSDREPFAGVAYWAKALDRGATSRQFPVTKFLVAARIDRGRPAASKEQIKSVCERFGFAGYFETSAAEPLGIDDLRESIVNAVPWGRIPTLTAPRVFRQVRRQVQEYCEKETILVSRDSLVQQILAQSREFDRDHVLKALQNLETADLVRELSFGELLLVQPEALDAYCATVALAARADPRGLGFIPEDRILELKVVMESEQPLENRSSVNREMLLATVQEVVDREIALRVETDKGIELGFPSEGTRESPTETQSHLRELAFTFEGPVGAIFATLAVRLTNSLAFGDAELFKNMALFRSANAQLCGFAVSYPDPLDEGIGRLEVFFGQAVTKDIKLLFLRYVNHQLQRLAVSGTLKRQRIYSHCGLEIDDRVVRLRKERKLSTVLCPVCEMTQDMDDLEENTEHYDSRVSEISDAAREEQRRQSRLVLLAERERREEYHVFICHEKSDALAANRLYIQLKARGILAWYDRTSLSAGQMVVRELEHILNHTPVAIVLIGRDWGKWQRTEYESLVQRQVEDEDVLIIPLLLPDAPDLRSHPFLRGRFVVDCRDGGLESSETLGLLVRAIIDRVATV